MVELEAETLVFVFLPEILDGFSVVVEHSVAIVHGLPLSLGVEVAHHVVDESPQELAGGLALLEEPVVNVLVQSVEGSPDLQVDVRVGFCVLCYRYSYSTMPNNPKSGHNLVFILKSSCVSLKICEHVFIYA